jgi:nucleotide-binding universal stress UspA family protein
MSPILVLVDFTETSKKAVQQAIAAAKVKNHPIVLLHISSSGESAHGSLLDSLKEYENLIREAGLVVESEVRKGALNAEVASFVKESTPSLVVIGTHGKKGVVQQLLGSKILKLVMGIMAPVLVVSDFSDVVEGGYKKVLLPVAPHLNFLNKVKTTKDLLAKDGKILLFTVLKPGVDLSDSLLANIEAAENFLTENDINWERIRVGGSEHFSVGFSSETIKYAKSNEIDLISIMTEVSDENHYFGKIDKENILINEDGLAVLAVH